ncbi:hypothetical protein HQ535_11085 [bacterium]|nr:hypothetical protein [bacterium]
MSALTATMALFSWVGGRATEGTSYRPVTTLGLAAISAGFLWMGLTWGPETTPATMAVQLALLGLGFGLVTAPTNAAAVDGAPSDRRGVVSGLVILARLIGLAVGLSGLTAWAIHRFDTLRSTIVLPPPTDPGYLDALDAAQASLSADALAETFLFSAALMVLAIVVAVWLVPGRHRPRVAHDA